MLLRPLLTLRPILVGTAAAALLAAAAAPLTTAAPTTAFQAPAVRSAPVAQASHRSTDVDPDLRLALAEHGATTAIVTLAPGQERSAVATAIARAGGEVTADLSLVDALAATLTPEALDALVELGVARVMRDASVQLAHGSELEPPQADTDFLLRTGAWALHRKGIDGSGVGVAVIDTGITEVDDLAGRVVGGIDLTPEQDGLDNYGHGTFVAGLIAGDGTLSDGLYTGMAPGAHLIPVKVAGRSGATDVSVVLAAIQWVVSHKDLYDIGVLNLSMGTDSPQDWRIDPLNLAVERAWQAGLVVVVSASNRGPAAGTVSKPGDDPWVITVGSLDAMSTPQRQDDIVPDYSGRGPTASGGIHKPDLVVAGSHLKSLRVEQSTFALDNPFVTEGPYMQGSGTSYATALVTGAVALLRQSHPDWTPDRIKGVLLASAQDGPVGDPDIDGAGRLAVRSADRTRTEIVANQGLQTSTGLGLLGSSRGTLAVLVADTTLGHVATTLGCVGQFAESLDAVVATATCLLDEGVETVLTLLGVLDSTTEETAQRQLFDGRAYASGPWTPQTWDVSQWSGHSWYHQEFASADWSGHSWYGHSWYGHAWY